MGCAHCYWTIVHKNVVGILLCTHCVPFRVSKHIQHVAVYRTPIFPTLNNLFALIYTCTCTTNMQHHRSWMRSYRQLCRAPWGISRSVFRMVSWLSSIVRVYNYMYTRICIHVHVQTMLIVQVHGSGLWHGYHLHLCIIFQRSLFQMAVQSRLKHGIKISYTSLLLACSTCACTCTCTLMCCVGHVHVGV